jgi:hypothetical protein
MTTLRAQRFRGTLLSGLVVAATACLSITGGAQAGATTSAAFGVPDSDCLYDSVAPRVSDVQVSPSSVDVTEHSAQIVIRVDVMDLAADGVTPSGIASVEVGYRLLHDAGGGQWVAVIDVPEGARPYAWSADEVVVRDKDWNEMRYHRADEFSFGTMPASWRTAFRVTDTTPDRVKPVITSVSVSPRSVDTRAHPARVHVALHATDDREVLGAGAYLVTDLEEDSQRSVGSDLHARGGGMFSGWISVPRWVGDSTWGVLVIARDAGGERYLYPNQLERRGWPSTVRVRSKVLAWPRLEEITVGRPAATADGGVRVPATAVVDGRGTPVSRVDFFAHHRRSWRGYGARMSLVTGTHLHGTWRGAFVVSHCASPGDYQLGVSLWGQLDTEKERVVRDIYGQGLARRGAPARLTLTTLTGDDVAPVFHWSQPALDHLTVTFSEDVRDVLPALALIDPTTGAPVPVLSVTCTTAEGADAPCSAGDAVVRYADFRLAQPVGPTDDTPVFVANLDVALPQITDRNGNPVAERSSPTP